MPADDSQLTLHWPGNARTFNPYSNLSLPSWFPVWFMFDQLVHLDPAANVVPQRVGTSPRTAGTLSSIFGTA